MFSFQLSAWYAVCGQDWIQATMPFNGVLALAKCTCYFLIDVIFSPKFFLRFIWGPEGLPEKGASSSYLTGQLVPQWMRLDGDKMRFVRTACEIPGYLSLTPRDRIWHVIENTAETGVLKVVSKYICWSNAVPHIVLVVHKSKMRFYAFLSHPM